MLGHEVGGLDRDGVVDRPYRAEHGLQEFVDTLDGPPTAPSGSDHGLGEYHGGHQERVPRLLVRGDGQFRALAMGVGWVDEAEQDARIENYRSHSFLSSSKFVSSVRPGTDP